jgi:hypothetical protein
MGDVFLLGAGFSHAINPAFPLVRDLSMYLGHYGTSWSDSEINGLLGQNFERAMSYLAENKPWLSETGNLHHRGLLLEITRNIGIVIGNAQKSALPDMGNEGGDEGKPY